MQSPNRPRRSIKRRDYVLGKFCIKYIWKYAKCNSNIRMMRSTMIPTDTGTLNLSPILILHELGLIWLLASFHVRWLNTCGLFGKRVIRKISIMMKRDLRFWSRLSQILRFLQNFELVLEKSRNSQRCVTFYKTTELSSLANNSTTDMIYR